MLQDIIDYLVSYIRSQHYSLLNKRCRDVYLRKYGLHIADLEGLVFENLLNKYSVTIDLSETCWSHDEALDYLKNLDNKILNNIKIFRFSRITPELCDILEKGKNIVNISGIVDIQNIDWLINLGQRKDLRKSDTYLGLFEGVELDLQKTQMTQMTQILQKLTILKNIGCKIIDCGGTPKNISSLVTDIFWTFPYSNNFNYSGVTKLHMQYFLDLCQFNVPNLVSVNLAQLSQTYDLVKQYPKIKEIGKTLVFTNYELDKCLKYYVFLHDFDFDLRYISGTIPKSLFEQLMKFELDIRKEKEKNGKPRFYRAIHANVDFEILPEYWDLFDLYYLTYY